MGHNFNNARQWHLICSVKLVLQQKRRPVMRTRIKELRARHDLTQDDLARMVGVRRETILYLEKGKYNPSLKLAHDVAKALKTTINDLFLFDKE
jgi:putative transcriptional regulator